MLTAVMFTACTEDVIVEYSGAKPYDDAPETLTIGFEDDETRIQLNEDVKTVWTKGDCVSVFYRSNANQKWQYQGETGERIAELRRVNTAVATETMKRVVVVYPYNENYYINTDTYNVQATLPAVQTYLSNSYALNGNIMISHGEYNNISLKSVCGWLKLQLTGNGEKVRSITLRGNDGEQVAGELYINSADATAILSSDAGSADDGDTGGAGGGLVFEDTILKEVVLDCGDGVELGAEATAFYIALPPQTFESGFTVEVECAEYETFSMTTTNSITIERNHIQPMSAFDYDGKPIVPNNQIWYTSSDGNVIEPYVTTNIESNTYSNGRGVITFDGELTEIAEYMFYTCSSITSVTIPDSVTEIGNFAFVHCNNLKAFKGKFATEDGRCLINGNTLVSYANASGTEYTIPDNVTEIGGWAFCGCSNLASVTIPYGVKKIGTAAFERCSALTSVTIPNSVTTLGSGAFSICSNLTTFTIPDSVEEFEGNPCTASTNIEKFYGKYAADDGRCLIKDNIFVAYANASGDKYYTIPDGVTAIGNYAFFGTYLTSVTMPDSVIEIREEAFAQSYEITHITIPERVESLGKMAFNGCSNLELVYSQPATPPAGSSDMFRDTHSDLKIYVSTEYLDKYKEAESWKDYADDIVGTYTLDLFNVSNLETSPSDFLLDVTTTQGEDSKWACYIWSKESYEQTIATDPDSIVSRSNMALRTVANEQQKTFEELCYTGSCRISSYEPLKNDTEYVAVMFYLDSTTLKPISDNSYFIVEFKTLPPTIGAAATLEVSEAVIEKYGSNYNIHFLVKTNENATDLLVGAQLWNSFEFEKYWDPNDWSQIQAFFYFRKSVEADMLAAAKTAEGATISFPGVDKEDYVFFFEALNAENTPTQFAVRITPDMFDNAE